MESSSEKTSSRRMRGFWPKVSSMSLASMNLRARIMERVSPREAEPLASWSLNLNR